MSVLRSVVGIALLAGVLALLPLANAYAQADDAYVQYRQKLMASQGAHMGSIGDAMKNNFHKDQIAKHAKSLALSASMIAGAFEKDISAGKTDAKPEVWKDWKKFEEKAKDLENAANKLSEMAMAGTMDGAAVKAVADACGGCHKDFRKPKEQSYKSM